MTTALSFTVTIRPVTQLLLWIALGLFAAGITCFIIGSWVGDLNEWFAFGTVLWGLLLLDLIVAFGSFL